MSNPALLSSTTKHCSLAETRTPFRFLELPAELRNQIYGYVCGKHSDRKNLVFRLDQRHLDALRYRATKPTSASTVLLLVNRQLHDEALSIMYEQNTFLVVFQQPRCHLEVLSGKLFDALDSRRAIPYGWDLKRIVHLCVSIELGGKGPGEWSQVLNAIELTDLPLMTSLRTLRFFMAAQITVSPLSIRGGPFDDPDDYFDKRILNHEGMLSYHRFIRNLIALVSRNVAVSLGLDDEVGRLKYYKVEDLKPKRLHAQVLLPPVFATAKFLGVTFGKFKGMRGLDLMMEETEVD